MTFALIMIASLLFLSEPSFAVDRYVDNTTSGCSTPSDTDYNPATESCGAGSELVYNTINGALAVEAANDTVYVRAGTYAEFLNNNITSGSGPGFTSVTSLIGWPGETVTIRPTTYGGGGACVFYLNGAAVHSIVVRNIIADGVNCTTGGSPVSITQDSGGGVPTYIRLDQVQALNSPTASGFLVAFSNSELTNCLSDNNGSKGTGKGGDKDHGVYLAKGANNLIHGCKFSNNTGWGIQIYPAPSNTIITNNLIVDNSAAPDCQCGGIVDSGDTDTIRNNVIIVPKGFAVGIAYGTAPKQNTIIEQNSIYCSGSCGNGIWFQSGTGMKARNNIVLGSFSTKILDSATGTTLTTNMTTGTPTAVWTNPATDDLTLKAGSAAINAGTDIGLPFNGSAPEQGAYETFAFSTANINTNVMEVALGMNLNVPVVPTSAGWSVGCSGTGCGTPVVSTAVLKSGTSSIVQLTITGITGTNCQTGQSWTVSYDDATGATTGSFPVSFKQELSAFSAQSVTNACSGGSTPWSGTLAVAATRFYGAKTDSLSALMPLAQNNVVVTVPAGAAFTYAEQTDCTGSDCTPIAERLYYTCAACPSGGADVAVPATAGADGIAFWGSSVETGLLSGAHGANLSGGFTSIAGSTNVTADSIPVFDTAQNTSIVMRYILRIVSGTPIGRTYCLRPREQTGVDLNSYTPAGGLCVTIGPPSANGGF